MDAQPPATASEPPTAAASDDSNNSATGLPASHAELQHQLPQQQHQTASCGLGSANPASDLLLPLDFPLLDQMLHLPPQSSQPKQQQDAEVTLAVQQAAAPAAVSSPRVLPCSFLDSMLAAVAADMQAVQKETHSLAAPGTNAGFMEAMAAAPPALLNRQAAPQLAAGMLPGSVAAVPGLHQQQQQCGWLSALTMAGGLLDGSLAAPGGVAAGAFSSRSPTSPAASSNIKRSKLADGTHAVPLHILQQQRREQQRHEQKKQQLVALLLKAKQAQGAVAEQQLLAERHQQRQQQAAEQMLPAWLRAFAGVQEQLQQQGRPEAVANAAAAAADPSSCAAMRLHALELLPGVPLINGDARRSSSGSDPRVQRLATTLASMPPLGLELLQSALQLVQHQVSEEEEEEQQQEEQREGKEQVNLLDQLLPARSGASAAGLLDLEIESAMERELLQQLQQNSSSSSRSRFDVHCLQPSSGDFGALLGPLPLGSSGGGHVLGRTLSDMLAGQQLLPQQQQQQQLAHPTLYRLAASHVFDQPGHGAMPSAGVYRRE